MSKTPVSILQEYCQSQKIPLPQYIEEMEGNLFVFIVNVKDIKAIGKGTSKKAAKQDCAKNAMDIIDEYQRKHGLLREQLVNNNVDEININTNNNNNNNSNNDNYDGDKASVITINAKRDFVSNLNEFASKRRYDYPVYIDAGVTKRGQFMCLCRFSTLETTGIGINKKIAKQASAELMHRKINTEAPEIAAALMAIHQKPANNVEVQINEIINVYEKLTLSRNQFEQLKVEEVHTENSTTIADDLITSEDEEIDFSFTYEGLVKKLEATIDQRFEISPFSMNPIVMQLQVIGSRFTMLAAGNTVNEAKLNVLRDTLHIIRRGCPLVQRK